MSFNKIDLDGGDLGRAEKVIESGLHFLVAAPHIAAILSKLPFNDNNCPSYAFEFRYHYKDEVEAAMIHLRKILPKNIGFYEVDGRNIFEIRGASGGVVHSLVCYLMRLRD
jgi:hypothetical protein